MPANLGEPVQWWQDDCCCCYCCYPSETEGICFTGVGLSVCLSVCLFVTTITKKIVDRFVPNFMRRFLGGKEDQVRVSLRSVEECESNGQELRKLAIVYILFF